MTAILEYIWDWGTFHCDSPDLLKKSWNNLLLENGLENPLYVVSFYGTTNDLNIVCIWFSENIKIYFKATSQTYVINNINDLVYIKTVWL